MMIILGGLGHLRGAVLGAFAFALLQEFFQSRGDLRRVRQALAAGAGPHDHRDASRCCPSGLVGPARARSARRARAQAAPGRADARRLTSSLRGERLTRRWGGLTAVNAVSLDLVARQRARRHRHQRRRQVDADQPAVRRDPAHGRARRAAGRRTSPRWTQPRARPRRPRPQLPAHHHLSAASRVLENCRLAAQARAPAALGLVGARAALRRSARRPRTQRRGSAPGSATSLDRAGRAAVARRASASSRSRCAWPPTPRGAAARRAAGRHGRRGDRAHAGAAGRAARPATRSCWSSTTWTRCSASPTASR